MRLRVPVHQQHGRAVAARNEIDGRARGLDFRGLEPGEERRGHRLRLRSGTVAYGRYGGGRRRVLKQLTPRDHGAPPQDGYREKSYPSLTISSSGNGASNVSIAEIEPRGFSQPDFRFDGFRDN